MIARPSAIAGVTKKRDFILLASNVAVGDEIDLA